MSQFVDELAHDKVMRQVLASVWSMFGILAPTASRAIGYL
jgi:uncharacterized phage-associated protein